VAEDSEVQNDAGKIFELGWRQGSVVSDELFQYLSSQGFLPKVVANSLYIILIVVSQDCDVCNDSYEKEPWVELLFAIQTEIEKRSFFNGKHPRQIQFEITNSETKKIFEASVHDRFRIDRKELANHLPQKDLVLSQETVRDIKHWLARRYVREGFPNEFERRVSSLKSKLTSKVFSNPKKGGLFTAIFLLTNEAELDEDEIYEVIMWLTMTSDDYSSQKTKEDVLKLAGQIAAAMNECKGIKVVNFDVKSEADVSLEERKQLKRWDYDALSFAEDLPTIKDD
jgi:hypothetical protein